jgi:hypothetical protein
LILDKNPELVHRILRSLKKNAQHAVPNDKFIGQLRHLVWLVETIDLFNITNSADLFSSERNASTAEVQIKFLLCFGNPYFHFFFFSLIPYCFTRVPEIYLFKIDEP